MANKFFNKRSAVVIDGLPKLPTPDSIEYGEIAINYADGVETISIKNSANEIVEFKSKKYFERIIENNEEIIAASLVHIDERIDEIEDNMAENEAFILLDEKVTNVQEQVTGVQEQVTDVLEEIEENEKVTAMSISYLNDEINALKTEQERLSADVEENEKVTAMSISHLNDEINGLKTEQERLSADAEENKKTVSEALNDIDERFNVLTPRVDNLYSTVDALPIVTDGDGSKFLGDDGVYHTIELNGGVDSSIVEELNELKQIVEENEFVTSTVLTETTETINANKIAAEELVNALDTKMQSWDDFLNNRINETNEDLNELKQIVEEGGSSDEYLKATLNEEMGAKVIQENVPIIFPQGVVVGSGEALNEGLGGGGFTKISDEAYMGFAGYFLAGEYRFDFDHRFVMTEDHKPAWLYGVTEGQLRKEISLEGHTHSEYALETNVPTKDEFTTLQETVTEIDEVTAAALNDLNIRFDNIGQNTVIQNLTTTITTLQQTIAELQSEITNIKNELNKTLIIE